MSVRESGAVGIILTLNDNNKDLTDQEAKKLMQRLLVALRDKAKKENWSYYIFVGFSRSNQKIIVKRAHFHIFLLGSPCKTITEWINNYWNPPKKSKRKSLGIVKRERVKDTSGGYFIDTYIKDQAIFTREQRQG